MDDNYKTDFMDINWVIDHVGTLRQRIDVLKKLGYRIGYNVYKDGDTNLIKSVVVGKRNELRVQVSEKIPGMPLVFCVILGGDDDEE